MSRSETCIALFRGINVGGRHMLPMKELAGMFESLGATRIRTYIQSGNVVFQPGAQDSAALAARLREEIARQRGFEPLILMLGLAQLDSAIMNNPFPDAEEDASHLSLGFLATVPKRPDLTRMQTLKKDSERFALVSRVFYLHAPEGFARSKLATSAERLLGVGMTARNWRTVRRLREMADE